jgi:mono/diheme cytochrome c family protein
VDNKKQLFLLAVLLLVTAFSLQDCRENPYSNGQYMYTRYCASCHMDDGKGLGALIPPLAGSDYLGMHRDLLPCIVRFGLKDTILVNGVAYDEPMAGIDALSDIDITNVLNYINSSWGNANGTYRLDDVRQLLKNCPQAR